MKTKIKAYAAGPDVFRSDPDSYFDSMKKIANQYNIEILVPEWVENHEKTFLANIEHIKNCDIIVAHIIPFRGVCIDDGTAFELGSGYVLNKVLYGYSILKSMEYKQVESQFSNLIDDKKLFPFVEDNGLSHNLMIYNSIYQSGGQICETYEECFKLINEKYVK